MKPTRAAWLFAAGLAWLVLRAILVHSLPLLRTEHVAQHGGLLLIVPLLSVVASATAPLFFFSFLFHHRFLNRRLFRAVTMVTATASLLSFAVVSLAFVASVRGGGLAETPVVSSAPWLYQTIPLFFVGSVVVFLAVFARQGGCNAGLRRAAAAGAVGTLVSTIMIAGWVIFSRVEGALTWYPAVSRSLFAEILGLAAAASLLWFLESFAVSYDDPVEVTNQG